MPKIEWEESYSVNNDEIDEQHKKWIKMYNDMHESLLGGDRKKLKLVLEETLKSMQDYANYHFHFEEQYMVKINFPDFINHKRLHKDFDTLIYNLNKDIEEDKLILNTEISSIIKNWLVQHILVEDKKYASMPN